MILNFSVLRCFFFGEIMLCMYICIYKIYLFELLVVEILVWESPQEGLIQPHPESVPMGPGEKPRSLVQLHPRGSSEAWVQETLVWAGFLNGSMCPFSCYTLSYFILFLIVYILGILKIIGWSYLYTQVLTFCMFVQQSLLKGNRKR